MLAPARQLANFVRLADSVRATAGDDALVRLAYEHWYLRGGYRAGRPLSTPSPAPATLESALRGALDRRGAGAPGTDPGTGPFWQSLPGFFTFAWAGAPGPEHRRVYVRMGAPAVPALLAEVVAGLDLERPLALKVRTTRAFASAADAVVLYVDPSELASLLPALHGHRRWTTGPAPALTWSPHPGIGIAPGCGPDSFGWLLCEAVVSAYRRGSRHPRQLLDTLDGGLRLGRGERRRLAAAWSRTERPGAVPGARRPRRPWRDTARRALDDLAAGAVWTGDACTWLTPVPAAPRSFELAGPDLYTGTAGIALTLARAGSLLDSDPLRAAARGGVRFTVRNLHLLPAQWRNGLLSGVSGALAAVRMACEALGDPLPDELPCGAPDLPVAPSRGHWDLVTGVAGLAFTVEPPGRADGARATPSVHERIGHRLRAVRTNQLGLAHGRLAVLAAQARFGASPDSARTVAALGLADPERARDYAARLWRRGGTTWCRGLAGLLVAHDLSRRLAGQGLDRAATALARRRLGRRVERCALGFEEPGALCHGPLGDAATLWFHDDRDLARPFLVEAAPWWYSHRGTGRAPGLLTGTAGFAHLLLHVMAAEDGAAAPRSPLHLLD